MLYSWPISIILLTQLWFLKCLFVLFLSSYSISSEPNCSHPPAIKLFYTYMILLEYTFVLTGNLMELIWTRVFCCITLLSMKVIRSLLILKQSLRDTSKKVSCTNRTKYLQLRTLCPVVWVFYPHKHSLILLVGVNPGCLIQKNLEMLEKVEV